MASYKGYGIAIALLLIQLVACHPLATPAEESKTEDYALLKAKFETFVRENSDKVIQIVREMLKDEKFIDSNDSDLKIIRNHFTEVAKQYDSIEKIDHYAEFLHYFITMPKNYMELPENRITAATKFMEGLLSKYGLTQLSVGVEEEFNSFIEIGKNSKKKQ